jgi:hypothetical protein
MSAPIILTHSLANDSRAQLESWLEDVETHAINQFPQHDISDALSLVVPDNVWQLVPGNIINLGRVAAGSPPAYRARPTWDMPAQHTNNATAAVLSI